MNDCKKAGIYVRSRSSTQGLVALASKSREDDHLIQVKWLNMGMVVGL